MQLFFLLAPILLLICAGDFLFLSYVNEAEIRKEPHHIADALRNDRTDCFKVLNSDSFESMLGKGKKILLDIKGLYDRKEYESSRGNF